MNEMELDSLICLNGLNGIASFTGLAAMNIPVFRNEKNIPFGCCMIAGHMEDAKLLGIMYALEQELDFR